MLERLSTIDLSVGGTQDTRNGVNGQTRQKRSVFGGITDEFADVRSSKAPRKELSS